MQIRLLKHEESPPYPLLLLADPSEEIVQNYLQRGTCYIGYNQKEKVMGVYVLLPTRPHTIEIVNLAVDKSIQGKGYGKQLLIHAIQIAKQQDYRTVEIGTANSSLSQLALYQKVGFRITSIDTNFFLKHYKQPIYENGIQAVDMLRLTKDLAGKT
ncbi:GNAT family N-acetyltransferase [Alkalihalobacillus pseudalcaliphilus]|uniref:GNAT family N-acetyltransferase n=1 Tax=Alkalihalobacillus pseudalcaliphilus TaxID=79884 RepID=UPI00064DFA87|nr:GNAT family N-acetyltransferase [Alkalihalobacillus pseudalcaliphilus]KMK77020.1 acetyltransferase [Alkalihalobacillus pseudalcaliphilus]